MNKKTIKIIITVVGVSLAITHLIFPSIRIDLITVSLIAIAIIPWVASLFKSVELPGGLKLEFQDLQRLELEAKESGLINKESDEILSSELENNKYIFVELAQSNPTLALVSLRIEIERRLRQIAEKYSVESRQYSMSRQLHALTVKGIITVEESSTLRHMLYTLNQAAHGIEFDQRTADWIIENGPLILNSLESKMDIRGGFFSHKNPESTKHWIDESYEKQNWTTNLEWSQHIEKHIELWKKEMNNLSESIIKKLNNNTEQIAKFELSQESWTKQQEIEKDFLLSINNFSSKIGREGQMIMASTFMSKYRERALELEEILSLIK